MQIENSHSIAVTMGEPAGIGPDIILQAWSQRQLYNIPHFTVIGSKDVLTTRNTQLGLELPLQQVKNADEALACNQAIPIIETKNLMKCLAGQPDTKNSAGVIEAIELALQMVINGDFEALTTCPINKKSLYDCGFEYPGHTEFLAKLCQDMTGKTTYPVMMLAGPQLRSVPVTIHIALCEVKNVLDIDLILKTARIVAIDLRNRFDIADAVMAFAGVNPHAGEEGAMGREEIDLILPAVELLRAEGFNVIGPLPADTMFHQRARQSYDVAICMYHDQALIPAKTLAFDDTVNVTLGLPIIRTSPDHGTAYNIAGTQNVKPDSFIAALKTAGDMVRSETKAP
ncbi:MAG: 4-hydroxythreonine-4-phosphate dehydrogenase PdxA [Hyphomicrobiales bacterium]|nr:4-hydroxythreonine-4-phosphate dehydrogenase PdxA [Hyphomicrobiales bacterium]